MEFHCPLWAWFWAWADFDYSAELDFTYSESDKRIKIDKKTATFRAGGGGLRLNAEHEKYGLFFGSVGYGYYPEVLLLGTTLSGPAMRFFWRWLQI